jgi:hypothetical protein
VTRLLPDPIPRSGGILTEFELECVRSVLKRLASRPAQGLSVTAWPAPSQNAFRSLVIAGYVGQRTTVELCVRLGEIVVYGSPMHYDGGAVSSWNEYRITAAGRTYLAQIGNEPTQVGLVAREPLEP